MVFYVPAGWPSAVRPPDSQGFEASAVTWLLDVLPPGYREQKQVHHYPVGLAVMARNHAVACLDGAREGYRAARAELGGFLPPGEIDAVLAVYRAAGDRQAATAREAGLKFTGREVVICERADRCTGPNRTGGAVTATVLPTATLHQPGGSSTSNTPVWRVPLVSLDHSADNSKA
jgi:hypothetical protein